MLAALLISAAAAAADLESELGRNETRVHSAATPMPLGQTVLESGLLDRLELRGYGRVHSRPASPGEFFFGESIFWIYRRAHRVGSREFGARLFGVEIAGGRMERVVDADRRPVGASKGWLEPVLLSESLDADRAPRVPVDLDRVPERLWRAVLAAEDHRFFDHSGLDSKAIARALVKNVQRGEVAEGGSTITQQLIKIRDLSPKRSLGRKASEAVRALSLEAEYTKEEILPAYLNGVYMGHVDAVAVCGSGAAQCGGSWLLMAAARRHRPPGGESCRLAGLPDRGARPHQVGARWNVSTMGVGGAGTSPGCTNSSLVAPPP